MINEIQMPPIQFSKNSTKARREVEDKYIFRTIKQHLADPNPKERYIGCIMLHRVLFKDTSRLQLLKPLVECAEEDTPKEILEKVTQIKYLVEDIETSKK